MSTATASTKPAQPEGAGILIPASKVHQATKTELLNILSADKSFSAHEEGGRVPKLVGVLATEKEDARNYAEFTRKSCESLGIAYELRLVGAARAQLGDAPDVGIDVEEAILEANEDDEVDGIMVYYPIHGGSQDQYLQQCVSPYKDVEGLNHKFLWNLYHNVRYISPKTLSAIPESHLPQSIAPKDDTPPAGTVKSVLPCTPLAIVKVLEFVGVYNKLLAYGDRARGKVITVINRSEVVGRPLAALLANDGARVLSVDIDSIVEFSKRPSSVIANTSRFNPHHVVSPTSLTLQECLKVSDVVISAVPSKDYKVKTEWLKDGCICVNVAGDKNFEADVRQKASIYVPSVGQMTIAMLQRNLLRLRKYREMAAQKEEEKLF
ncbi:Methylenetetrahydrofolate dehydrogenase [NAD(+)] [Naganishia albida]|nr:Methylenetetrahydrofolate dehydrogenase [NAD(+)] [Naganishia albida]